jgi:hypothetical protein
MPIEHVQFRRLTLDAEQQADVGVVAEQARVLSARLADREREIDLAHIATAGSTAIQSIVSTILLGELGFQEEVVLTKEDGLVVRPRPDFVWRIGPGRGVMVEVERGGTITNNHDLKDMWKAHVARDLQHLILVVPHSNWRANGAGRERPYPAVIRRVGAFFGDPRREVDVWSAHVIGYGRKS